METTFISIHDLSLDARLLYVSDSIYDILGYRREEIVGKSCWEYFHPDEIPFARAIHGRGVKLDKAAVLNYCQIKDRRGFWISCECVFTVVYDVLVASTSIYRAGTKSQRRAADAPIIRQLFSSPRDPRYDMLSHLSTKFTQDPNPDSHEPRAALFLNRFTRTLPIMYATNGLENLLGISSADLTSKSFYYCIQENCLQEAVRCLESAKANDSIAYLRFWFRDPRQLDPIDQEENMLDAHSSEDDDDGGVHLDTHMDTDSSDHAVSTGSSHSRSQTSTEARSDPMQYGDPRLRSSSGNSTDIDGNANDGIFDQPATARSSASSLSAAAVQRGRSRGTPRRHSQTPDKQIELEAVVSCTSDGLVVILRAARPFFPPAIRPPQRIIQPAYANGLFASPWATEPIMPNFQRDPWASSTSFQPSMSMQASNMYTDPSMVGGPQANEFMRSIREVAVFAWSLTGINGSLAQYSRGTPRGEAQPPGGLPDGRIYQNQRSVSRPYNMSHPSTAPESLPSWEPGSQSIRAGPKIGPPVTSQPSVGIPVWSSGGNAASEGERFNDYSPSSQTRDVDTFWTNKGAQGAQGWTRRQQIESWNSPQHLLSLGGRISTSMQNHRPTERTTGFP